MCRHGLAGIEYNYLNLPSRSRVSKNLTDYMVYTYDATGTKLSQQVFGAEAGATEYVGKLVFQDNVLQFILHPEGRVVADTPPFCAFKTIFRLPNSWTA